MRRIGDTTKRKVVAPRGYETMEWIAESSPRLKSRVAGVLYLLAVLTAAFAEGFVQGKLLYVAGLIPVAWFVVVTLLFYQLFRPVNRRLALLAALFNLVEPHLGLVERQRGFRDLDGLGRLVSLEH